LASAAAFNSAVTAATFFTIREYIVSPTLGTAVLYSRQRRGDTEEPHNVDNLSWSSLRRHHLLDSGVSGAATGGILRGLMAGRRTVAPAAITAGMVCALLQAAYNELGIQRIKYVSKLPQSAGVPIPEVPPTPSLTSRILGAVGVQLLTDEELLMKLKQGREKHLKKIAELERELEADKQREAEKQ
ncbi:hypothetical protein DFH06DRAFT_969222, partial [Mycena polygramma]